MVGFVDNLWRSWSFVFEQILKYSVTVTCGVQVRSRVSAKMSSKRQLYSEKASIGLEYVYKAIRARVSVFFGRIIVKKRRSKRWFESRL